jgi:hypothetical protein
MGNNMKLRRAIWDYIDERTLNGQAVDIDNLALALSSRYPQSGMTIGDICVAIEAALRANGASAHRPAAQ